MKSRFNRIIGRKDNKVLGNGESDTRLPWNTSPSTPQPHVTTGSPQTPLQSLTVRTASPRPIQSANGSHTALNSDPNASITCQPGLREQLFPNGQIYGLRILYEPAEPLVDIVFVHGLTGNSYDTWLEPESQTYWPVHLLSKDVPDARIMAFGYDADVTKFLGPVSQNNLRDHATGLLGRLAAVRGKDDSKDRKIIFVVHSLGGLVTKKALCLSEHDYYPQKQQIERCTIAVAFLGTPHRGSGLTPFASSVANILRAGGKRVNTEIVQLLRRNSEVLADIEDSYAVWVRRNSSRFDLTCFYEELELPAIGMVVTKESATIVGYPHHSIHANHMGMTKFRFAQDEGYMQICDEVNGWLGPLRTQAETTPSLTEDEKDCLRSLSFSQMNDRSNDIEPAAKGTCAWLLRHQTYIDWISRRRGLLWIKGKPGAGKSTLLKYGLLTIPTMESPSRKLVTISFFFHGRGAEIQKTPLGLYRSLLHQLLSRFPIALADVVQTFKSRCASMGKPGEKWNWHTQELQDFVESSLAKILEESAIRIFVDALDECGEEVARRLVRSFQLVYSKCSSAPQGLSICFSCRHWPVIAPDNCLEIYTEHENHEDIRTYIKEELQRNVHDPKELETLQDRIEARSEWVFQWVVLVLPRIVRMCTEGKSLRQCLAVLEEIPQDLNDLYETIIRHLKARDQFQSTKLFQWICFALRPLSVAELRCAMNVEANPEYQSFKEFKNLPGYIETDTQMEKQLLSLSGGLAEWKTHEDNKHFAQLIHQSLKDYLISNGLHQLDSSLDSVDRTVSCSHSRLSRSCIVYFAMDELVEINLLTKLNKYSARAWRRDHEAKEYPFLKYAVESWLLHAQIAEEKGMPQEDLLQYLQRHPYWTMRHWCDVHLLIDGEWTDIVRSGTTLLHVASAHNLISLVSALLNNGGCYDVDVDSKDAMRWTPLSYAAKNGHEAVVKLLLARSNVNVDSKDECCQTPLSWAAENGHEAVVKLLLARSDVDADSKNEYNQTPLSLAAENGHEGVVKLQLARSDVDADSKDKDGQTPVIWAAKNGHEAVVKLLLARSDVNADSKDDLNKTPLSWAAENGNEAVIKLLLAQSYVNADSKDVGDDTPLSYAAENGHKGVVKLLLARSDVEADSKDGYNRTPLSFAAQKGHEGVVKLLLARSDVNVDSKDHWGLTPLSHAAENGHEAVVKLLKSKGARSR